MTNTTTQPAITPPRGPGRPALPIGTAKRTRMELRTTAELAGKAARMAAAAGLSVNAWIERRIMDAR